MPEKTLTMSQKIKKHNSNYAKALQKRKKEEREEGKQGGRNRTQDTKDTYKEASLGENVIEEYT